MVEAKTNGALPKLYIYFAEKLQERRNLLDNTIIA